MDTFAFFLLSYPMSILSNLSSEFIKDYFKSYDAQPLRSLFINAFLKSLKENKKRVDKIGARTIEKIIKSINNDNYELFELISDFIDDEVINIEMLRDDVFKNKLSEKFCKKYDLIHIRLSKEVISDALYNYEVAFYNEMSIKEGLIYLIKMLNKLNKDTVNKDDFNNLKKELLKTLKQNQDSSNYIIEIKDFIKKELLNPTKQNFSEPLILNMKKLKKTIASLTKDQFQIIHYLKHKERVIISGCAGSGKTLLAVEKAIRLDKAGISTLILTHSPFLSNYISEMTVSTNIQVFDFNNFICQLINMQCINIKNWNEYLEPLEKDINQAFDKIIEEKIYFDAIIVDEGQEFRELWWVIIEALSENSKLKMLYIFHDDNQSLLNFKPKFPISESPFSMSKNCRNAGNIFEVVKRFHLNAPLTSEFLKETGIFELTIFDKTNYLQVLESTIDKAQQFIDIDKLEIIVNEDSLHDHILNNKKVIVSRNHNWKNILIKELTNFRNSAIDTYKNRKKVALPSEIKTNFNIPKNMSLEQYFKIPEFSERRIPTKKEIIKVVEFTKKVKTFFDSSTKNIPNKIRYTFNSSHSKHIKVNNSSLFEKLEFYSNSNWSEKLINPTPIFIKSKLEAETINKKVIPLSNIDMFKGLESDYIILFINAFNKDILKEIYIGSSRAMGFLHILLNKKVFIKLKQFKDYKSSNELYNAP